MADVVAVASQGQVGHKVIAKVERMMAKLKTVSLSLHGKSVVERTAYARALMDNIHLQ